jgi:hypothetical protein
VVFHYCYTTNGPIFFLKNTINSERFASDILCPFFESITEEEITYGNFMYDCAAAHTASYSINILNEVKIAVFWVVAPCTNPEDSHLHTRRRVNLKAFFLNEVFEDRLIDKSQIVACNVTRFKSL